VIWRFDPLPLKRAPFLLHATNPVTNPAMIVADQSDQQIGESVIKRKKNESKTTAADIVLFGEACRTLDNRGFMATDGDSGMNE
jgi:hypothetical protein